MFWYLQDPPRPTLVFLFGVMEGQLGNGFYLVGEVGVGIDAGGGDAGVAQELLGGEHVRTAADEVSAVGMAELMGREVADRQFLEECFIPLKEYMGRVKEIPVWIRPGGLIRQDIGIVGLWFLIGEDVVESPGDGDGAEGPAFCGADLPAGVAVVDDDLSPDVEEIVFQVHVFPMESTGFLGTQSGVQHEGDAHPDRFPAEVGFDDCDLLRGIDGEFPNLVGLADADVLTGIFLDIVVVQGTAEQLFGSEEDIAAGGIAEVGAGGHHLLDIHGLDGGEGTGRVQIGKDVVLQIVVIVLPGAVAHRILFQFDPLGGERAQGRAPGDDLIGILERPLVFLPAGGLGGAGEGLLLAGAVRHGHPDPVFISSSFFTKTSGSAAHLNDSLCNLFLVLWCGLYRYRRIQRRMPEAMRRNPRMDAVDFAMVTRNTFIPFVEM